MVCELCGQPVTMDQAYAHEDLIQDAHAECFAKHRKEHDERIESETVAAIVAWLREPSVAAEMPRQPMTVADFIEREWKRGGHG